jgi:hypothetical protein
MGSISVNGSLVATVNPSLMPRAVRSAASQAVTYQLSSAYLDQLFDDACLVLSTVPDSLPAVGACLLMPTCPTSLKSAACSAMSRLARGMTPCHAL